MRKVARPPACGDRNVFRCLATEVAPVCGIPACLHACLPACAHDSVHARTCTHRNQRLRRQQAQRRTERSHVPSGRSSSWIPACRCAPSQLPPAPNDALNDVLGPRVSRAHGTRVSIASNGKAEIRVPCAIVGALPARVGRVGLGCRGDTSRTSRRIEGHCCFMGSCSASS